jgi:RNA polymerase sigma-70 factor, ECF subfamily
MNDHLSQFEEQRDYLERLAYRMLGSRSDADDILQEAFLRWSRTKPDDVKSPRAYLAKVVTRLCIDRRREIDVRKETYIGPWLPEPIVQQMAGADRTVELAETVSLAMLHVLERLSPVERAAYVLRQIFDYEYGEIAEILQKSATNCRQLVSRAEQRVLEGRPRFAAAADEVARISGEFLRACSSGDLDGLLQLLTVDAIMISDGGGKVTAARRPVEGADRVARFFLGIFRKFPACSRTQMVLVNGQPGLAAWLGDELVTVFAFELDGNRIRSIFAIRNPDKLPLQVGECIGPSGSIA